MAEPAGAPEKRVDESWKDTVAREKVTSGAVPRPADTPGPAPAPTDFATFLSGLGMQAMIALGRLPNPVTRRTEKDLTHAEYVIETLGMLQQKTRGNLTKEETEMLEQLLYELRLIFVEASRS